MGRVTVIISVCFLATLCLGQEEPRYHNYDWHFSFVLPENWVQVPTEMLSSAQKKLINDTFRISELPVLCQKKDSDYLTTPYIFIQYREYEGSTDIEHEKFFLSDAGRKRRLESQQRLTARLQEAPGCLSMAWKNAALVQTDIKYDPEKHASIETVELHNEKLGKALSVTVILLGGRGATLLRCYADGEDAEQFLDLVQQVVDSFAFEEGYGFGETKGVAPRMVQKLLGNTWQSWLLWAVGIAVASWLIYRWVTSEKSGQ